MALFLGIDLGTSYFKAGLFDETGTLRGLGRKSVKKTSERGKSCELPVNTFWSTLHACIKDALHSAKADVNDIQAISYSSQANSFIILDAHNQPLTQIILWPDTRADLAKPALQKVSEREDFQRRTGMGIELSVHSAVAKLLWLQKEHPDLWSKARNVMSISDYLIFRLTGKKMADYSTASLSGILDIEKGQWWDEALKEFNLEASFFPALHSTGTCAGNLTVLGAQRLGLSAGIPVCLGGLDHHVAAIGAGLYKSNDVSESTGTVLACVNYKEEYLPQKNVCIARGMDDGQYFQMAFNENGAGSLEWYQRKHAPELSIAQLLETASGIPPGSDGLTAKPSAWSYSEKEGFVNINPAHTHGHFVRAILESTAKTLSTIVNDLTWQKQAERIVSTGGGAMSRLWIQIKADITGNEFFIPECSESACLGAAMLAALSVKKFSNIEEASRTWIRKKEIIKPDPANHEAYSKLYLLKEVLHQ